MRIKTLIFILCLIPNHTLYSQGSIMIVGGGGEDYRDWSDKPYGWFVQQADSGKIINIDADKTSDWYANYFKWLGAAETSRALQIPDKRTADDSATYNELTSASAIFIEGGDQWDYVRNWKGTLVEDAIHYVFEHGGAIGGNSAGLAVLGEVVFDARYGTPNARNVAYNPYDSEIQMTDDFLAILPGVITDSHFHPRGRLGRLVTMVARRIQDHNQDLLGIGVDNKTALCIHPDLTAKVYGKASVTMIHRSNDSKIVCQPGTPLTFTNINCELLWHEMEYDLKSRSAIDPEKYLLEPKAPPPRPFYRETILDGSDENTAKQGEVVITGLTSSETNAWYGRLMQTSGDSIVPHAAIIPQIWNEYDFFENRWIGGFWGTATHPHYVAIYLDDNCSATISTAGILTVKNFAYIFDSYGVQYIGLRNGTNHPAMIGVKLHFLSDGDTYNLSDRYVEVYDVDEDKQVPDGFNLFNNYPNPFNSTTTFSYKIPHKGHVYLEILNPLGQQIDNLVDEHQNAGFHKIRWHVNGLSSGIYFYRISYGEISLVNRCLFLK